MDEWVHCNLCGQQLAKGISFFLTTCSHIFCERCKEKGTKPCAMCQRKCDVATLNEKLDANIQMFFSPPEKLSKKQIEVSSFQQKHKSMLIKHLRKKIEQQSKMLKNAEEYFRKQHDEIKKLRYEQSLLKKYINSYKAHHSGHSLHRPSTPRQLQCSPNMISPRHGHSRTRSPMVTGFQMQNYSPVDSRKLQSPIPPSGAAPRYLSEMQNTPANAHRLSIRPRPIDGKIGTPSPRAFLNSGTNYLSRSNSPLVVSTDTSYKPSPRTNLQALSAQWNAPTTHSAYFGKIGPTPPCTPKHVSLTPSVCSTPLVKFGDIPKNRLR